jgi:cytochrome c554/c'-like protein
VAVRHRGARWLSGLAAWLVLATLTACSPDPGSADTSTANAPPDPQAFLAQHWQRPLPAQGPAPATFTAVEASLEPASCGQCHPRQYEDWQTALHSQAMSPGLYGQLQEMGADARDDHQSCLRCHAPLAEQADHLQAALSQSATVPPPGPGGASYAHGLTCAGCHVRNHQRFGPPRRDGSVPRPKSGLPHDGWQVAPAFGDSRFCAACHQFEADGPALNGKLLENTYEEWRASRHAQENRPCQSCHMPDRRHLWRGIHDPEMVRAGLRIETAPPTVAGGQIASELQITNHGVGHAFPTYVTPHVVVEIGQQAADGKLIPNTVERHLIARDVTLDLTAERADTRIMPDEVRRYAYRRPLHPRARGLVVRITVEPDAFYADFYRATLRDPSLGKGRAALREALRRAEATPYVLYQVQHKIAGPT